MFCSTACRLGIFPDHKSFVQGVAFDPLGELLATMSSDRYVVYLLLLEQVNANWNQQTWSCFRCYFSLYRCCRIYNSQTKNCVQVIKKLSVASSDAEKPLRSFSMFHDDTMKSFFRRLTFTPDGLLLIVPAGCYEAGDNTINTTYVFARNNLSR